jgi:hypothetical protein
MVSIGDESYVAWREDSEEQEAIRQMDGDVFRSHTTFAGPRTHP